MLIFAIDDERLLLEEARLAIAEAAPEAAILTFSSAQAALDAVRAQRCRPDIVFSDIEMPGLSGLEFAVALKTISPGTRVVFVTGYSKYAVDAFQVRAQGYIMKPLKPELVRTELVYLPREREPDREKLTIRCFGHFEVFWQGEPVLFERKQTKELFAYLIDRRGAACVAEDVIAALWEGGGDMKSAKQKVRNLVSDLRTTLENIGMSDVLIRRGGRTAVRPDRLNCDYYRMLEGDMEAVNAFRGEYMVDYSWAELTAGTLHFQSVQRDSSTS